MSINDLVLPCGVCGTRGPCPHPNEHDGSDADPETLADIDLEYRGRGRPRLPPEQRRREKLVVSLTEGEKRRIMVAAASDRGSKPSGPQDWARRKLLELAPPLEEEGES